MGAALHAVSTAAEQLCFPNTFDHCRLWNNTEHHHCRASNAVMAHYMWQWLYRPQMPHLLFLRA